MRLRPDGMAARCFGREKWLWHRRVLGLALPIVAANLTQPLLSTVDTAIAGHLDQAAALGGVALGGLVFNLLFWGLAFLRMSTTALIARAWGCGDHQAMRDHLYRALILALALGVGLVAVKGPLLRGALDLLGGSPQVRTAALAYGAMRLWSAPFALGNFVILGYLLGRQKTTLSLLVQGGVNLVNIAAALALVRGAGWGLAGLGGATALADTAGFAVGLAVLARLRCPSGAGWRRLLDGAALRRLLGLNRDIFLRTLCLMVCFAWFTHAGALAGDTILAANAVLLNFQTIMAYLLDGFAQAAETLVGAALGNGRVADYRGAVRFSTLWAVLGAGGFSLAYGLAGSPMIAAMTDIEAVRVAARSFLPWAVALPLVSVWSFQLDGIFIGAARTRPLRDGMALSMLGYLAAAAVLPAVWGNHGLWAAFLLFMILRAATLGYWLPGLERDALRAARP